MKKVFSPLFFSLFCLCTMNACKDQVQVKSASETEPVKSFGGYATMEQLGEHLVAIAACNDCHTPKIMTPQGPVFDTSRLLSGHPAQQADLDVDRAAMEGKGYTLTNDLTAWIGPWGVSYTANLTSDSTGIGNWKEEQFIYAIRNGKLKGLPQSRSLLPPMPWPEYKKMTDDELKAIFAYLKSTKPIRNIVPQPKPPVAAH